MGENKGFIYISAHRNYKPEALLGLDIMWHGVAGTRQQARLVQYGATVYGHILPSTNLSNQYLTACMIFFFIVI